MSVFLLDESPQFPDPRLADPEGLLAVGGDLSPERLLTAYEIGVFPWFSEDEQLLWWSPDPRLVLIPGEEHIGRTLRRTLRDHSFKITFDQAFADVIRQCASVPRSGQDGTWITKGMVEAYCTLHALGYAHSVEAWDGDSLVGGLYGIGMGSAFFGESMFSLVPDASKVAFATMMEALNSGDWQLVDCQVHTDHLIRLGAREIPRDLFLDRVAQAVEVEPSSSPW